MSAVTNAIKCRTNCILDYAPDKKALCSEDTLTVFQAVLRFFAQYITAPKESKFEHKHFFLISSNICFTNVSDKMFLLLVTIIVHLFFHSFTV